MRPILTMILLAAAVPSVARAQDTEIPFRSHAGAALGMAALSCSGCDARFSYGAGFGTRLSQLFGVAVHFATSSQGVGDFKISQALLMGEASYFLTPEFRVGVRAGAAFENLSTNIDGVTYFDTEPRFAAGAQAGYDHPIAQEITVGGEVTWNMVMSEPETYTVFNFLVPVKLWF